MCLLFEIALFQRFITDTSCGSLARDLHVLKIPLGQNYLHGAVVTFTCKPEYLLHGDTTRTCLNGTWSPGWPAWCRCMCTLVAPPYKERCSTQPRIFPQMVHGYRYVFDIERHYNCCFSHLLVIAQITREREEA